MFGVRPRAVLPTPCAAALFRLTPEFVKSSVVDVLSAARFVPILSQRDKIGSNWAGRASTSECENAQKYRRPHTVRN
jgi:hypothetical protein